MKQLLTVLFVLSGLSLSAQTIFYYGNDSVQADEFLRAWKKNNTIRTEKAFRDYLHLYIASRLKIREARAKGLDTLPQMVADLQNLRQQILPAYLTDKKQIDRLVEEAYQRSQKDIQLAHIFISMTGEADTLAGLKKLEEVKKGLQQNIAFAELVSRYTDDPFSQKNGGRMGWVSVFTLPYEFENLAYSTPPGKISRVYRSAAGFHIFKNLGERKSPGRIKAAQILLAFPPGTDEAGKAEIKRRADSLYARIQKGDDFGTLAAAFSNDVMSAAANGQMPEFGAGEFDPVFENAAFALTKDGQVGRPFQTSHGFHIVKRISLVPAWNKKDEKSMQLLRDKVEQSDRMHATRMALAQKILASTPSRRMNFTDAQLWSFSDSIMNYKTGGLPSGLGHSSTLLQLGDKTITGADWINYAQSFRYKPNGAGLKPYTQVWNEFQQAMALEYYQEHLEDFNPEFRNQITEFREGNLFFEIMQREVWGPAQTDTAALQQFFERNRTRYQWNKSAEAVIFYAADASAAQDFREELKKSPLSWRELANRFNEKIASDSARFEIAQIPNPANEPVKAGLITGIFVNPSDHTASFAYVIHIYPATEPRSFSEARGLVINDYQADLEKSWIEELKRKYPVRVNEGLVREMVRNKRY